MPTTRPRHQVTETPDVERALDQAAQRWPGEPRGKLLLRLVHAGSAALDRQDDAVRRERAAAIDESAGAYSDAFEVGYLAGLRQEWPE